MVSSLDLHERPERAQKFANSDETLGKVVQRVFLERVTHWALRLLVLQEALQQGPQSLSFLPLHQQLHRLDLLQSWPLSREMGSLCVQLGKGASATNRVPGIAPTASIVAQVAQW